MKWFRILAVALSLVVLLTWLLGCGPKSVTFPDANLEAAIRGAISKPEGPIYIGDLEALATLGASWRGISNLTGLEYCVNLESLDLEGNNISDISALAGLTNMEILDLYGNNISDLSPLAGLTNLWLLNLPSNNINDISALAGLTNLERLSLKGNNNISDISALAVLTNLDWLDLGDNNISDISPLVKNIGLSAGDTVALSGSLLNTTSVTVYIPQLEARGVTVIHK